MHHRKGFWPLARIVGFSIAVAAILLAGVVGATAVAQSGIEASSHTGSSIDTRTVVLALVAALSGTIGFYARSVEKKVDGLEKDKMDAEMCKLLMAQHQRVADAMLEQVRALITSSAQNDHRINTLELSMLKQHPTREELEKVLAHSLDPVRLQLNHMQAEITKLANIKGLHA